MNDALTLYGERFWISPYVFSCVVALREKGLSYQVKTIALDKDEQKRADYAQKSITGKVPALDHDGFSLAESSAIIEYLEEAFPPPQYPRILPEALRDRARARQVMAWIRSDLAALREERPTTTMFYSRATKPLTAGGQAAAEKLCSVASRLIADDASTLFGAFSIADADLAFMLHRLILNGHPVPPKVAAFAQGIWRRPSVQSFVTEERPPFEAYR